MRENDFGVSTEVTEKRDFLKRIGALFTAAIFLTGICSVAGVVSLIQGIRSCVWRETGMAAFVWREFYYLIMLLALIMLIKMAIDEKPFSRTLTWGIRIAGILFIGASLIIPRLSGYQSSGFEIFSSGKFVLIDGGILLPGILLIILGNLIMAAFDMQKEIDEIL